jgi:Ca2+-binding EF-hand superfamily protein
VARWLLEKVAIHSSLVVAKAAYEGSNGKQTTINLVLTSMCEDDSYDLMDENHKHLISGYRRLLLAAEDMDLAERVFLDADLDGNNKLDREELTLCLEDLGYPMEPETVDDIFTEFDVDFSGTLEREEFFHFLSTKVDETKARLTEILERYFYALAVTPQEVYTPPKTGILHMSIVNNFTDKGPKNVVTAIQQRYAFEQAVKTGDANLVSEFIQHTRLRYNEALGVYKAINAENGNMAAALSKVLVRMLNTSDARALLAKVTANDALKVTRVKQALGNAYHPLLGNCNGFYSLNLSQEMDRLCVTQLLEHSKVTNSRRYKEFAFGCLDGKLGDTSQHGNWTSFRNEVYNNEPFQITSAAFIPMKRTGILEFDYTRYVWSLVCYMREDDVFSYHIQYNIVILCQDIII